ncbi:MAG: serine kinase [Betaproteobacteria bacterium]
MFFYTAYNLGIHSQIPLRGLVEETDVPKDVSIQLREIDRSEKAMPRDASLFLGETPGVAMFLVRAGQAIVVDPAPGAEELLLGALVLGPLMAVLLRQRGYAVLHASSIATNAGAVVFLGDSGSGKSTLAGAFYESGYGIMTDDVMPVRFENGHAYVVPGYPSVKLFPHTATLLGCETTAMDFVHPQIGKRSHSVAQRFPAEPLQLCRMYVLAEAEVDSIEPLRPQEIFRELVRNSRAATLLRDPESLHAHLRDCTRLAADISVFRLRRRRAISSLPQLIQLIEQHLAQDTQTPKEVR